MDFWLPFKEASEPIKMKCPVFFFLKCETKIFEISIWTNKFTSKKNKKVIICGNGGSAATSSHVSVDLTKMRKLKQLILMSQI